MTLREVCGFEMIRGDKNTSGAQGDAVSLGWNPNDNNNYWERPAGRQAGGVALGSPGTAGWAKTLAHTYGRSDVENGLGSVTLYTGFAIKVNASNPSGNLCSFNYSGGTNRAGVSLTNGVFKILSYSIASSSTQAQDSTSRFGKSTSSWYFVEISLTTGSNNVVVEIRLDGISVLSTPFTSSEQAVNTLTFGSLSTGFYLDDFYICDSSGSANNTFLGDCRVELLTGQGVTYNDYTWPNEAGSVINTSQFNSLATIDGDTSYVRGSTPNTPILQAMSDLAASGGTVLGVQVTNVAQREAGSGKKLGGAISIGSPQSTPLYATPTSRSTTPPAGYYGPAPAVFELSPATGTNFTVAEVNALHAGPVVLP